MTVSSSQHRALITGGAGFIGSHLCELLLARGDHVTVIDNLSTGRRSNLPPHPSLSFIEGDLARTLAGLKSGTRFDQIYHLAAAVGVKLIMDDPIGSLRTNIDQTEAILEFASAAGTPTLIASSSEVYGKGSKSPFAENDDVVYGPTSVLRWSYACGKALDEYLALAHARQRGLPVVVARFFNTVGPRQVGEYGMVLPRFVAAALRDQPIEVHGDGSQSRCFADVRDVVRALPALLEQDRPERVFNLGHDESVTIGRLAELVVKVTGSRSTIRRVPYEQVYAQGFEDLRERRPDLTRLRRAIAFQAAIPLEKTIADIAAWLRARPG